MAGNELVVTAEALNVRSAPSLQGQVVHILAKGATVRRLDTSGDGYWHKVDAEGITGWASGKYLRATSGAAAAESRFPWFAIAYAELGVREVVGSGDNPRIVEYLRSTTLAAPYNSNDETAWCSAFANWCVEQAGYAGTDSAWARSWLNWGRATNEPVTGCMTVFSRDLNFGHVAFFVSRAGDKIKVLGGNQSNAVTVADYPAARLLGYRLPT
ncbi:MAG TPA: TIGR02594 family protein [Burkholderiales bacterium]|nr:TIGR02594 family protein [Burkholderiales bacterium]